MTETSAKEMTREKDVPVEGSVTQRTLHFRMASTLHFSVRTEALVIKKTNKQTSTEHI